MEYWVSMRALDYAYTRQRKVLRTKKSNKEKSYF